MVYVHVHRRFLRYNSVDEVFKNVKNFLLLFAGGCVTAYYSLAHLPMYTNIYEGRFFLFTVTCCFLLLCWLVIVLNQFYDFIRWNIHLGKNHACTVYIFL